MKPVSILCCAALAGLLAVGCGGDIAKMLASNSDVQARVMETIAGNPDLAGRMLDRFLAADSTRALVMEKLLGNSDVMQSVMAHIARDRIQLDGVLSFAVQDTAMKRHVMTLFQGMQLGAR